MITYDQAIDGMITEFHISHNGLPCTVWHRGGVSYSMGGDGFFVPVFRNEDPADHARMYETEWHHITGVNAGDFHIADECPRLRMGDDRPPVSDRSEDHPTLGAGQYDADGYDAFGFNAGGYDRNGYDADGYDADGYDADGYDADGYDADGNPRPGSLDASDLDLADLWAGFSSSYFGSLHKVAFRRHLCALVRNPGDIDELAFCDNCDDPEWDDSLTTAGEGSRICPSCWDDWYDCSSCDDRFPSDDLNTTLTGSSVCDRCRDSYYSWCDNCDGYYPDADADDHDHDYDRSGGCCASPQLKFRIRNDGCEPLANDTRITITLPAGTISHEGLQEITYYLQRQGHYDLSYGLHSLGDQWQTRDGNYAKRLSRLAYQRYQAKLTPEVMSQIGCIARNHSNPVDVTIEVSRQLNQSAADWYHEDSCWWGSYSESRCTFKTNGGFGIRSFTGSRSYPSGRAWVLPLRLDENENLVPTFETETPDAFVVFNGYGDLSNYAAPRILAHMAGWTYRKIGFSCNPMYINSGGYLIAPEHIAKPYTDGELYLSVRQHSSLFTQEQDAGRA